ncbi:nitrogen regulatory protein PII [Streptococcus rupicaprae]|uniref:Nitrogen regulatory protein PII n=1 Tax=Streptococcus rupicaprae TaxID=759619 RepID=A0ABV2FHA4_9STRE
MKVNQINSSSYTMLYVIVNYGSGSKVMHCLKKVGIPGGTIIPGLGTVKHGLLNFLSLYEEEKEIVAIGTDNQTAEEVTDYLDKIFQFDKPHHGLVMTVPLRAIVGSRRYLSKKEIQMKEKETMYQLITTIVERGRAEEVIEAAQSQGSRGGTILNGRGAGIHETSTLFQMAIEPEKEVVWIITETEKTEPIVNAIESVLAIDQPGQGIIFVQDISDVRGLYRQKG